MVIVRETPTSESMAKSLGEEETKQELLKNDHKISDVLVVNEAKASKNNRKGCKKPCNEHDKHLIGMLVGIIFLVLAFMYLKKSRHTIEPIM